ncbi:MAG: hypothetical protein WA885_11435 [Phormidesmis sp.]
MRTKQRRALVIGLCLAFVMLLGKGVSMISTPTTRPVIAFNEEQKNGLINKPPTQENLNELVFRYDWEKGNHTNNVRFSNLPTESVANRLEALNNLKTRLQEDLVEISVQENPTADNEREKVRIQGQVLLINTEIDEIISRDSSLENESSPELERNAPVEPSTLPRSGFQEPVIWPSSDTTGSPLSVFSTQSSPLMQVAKWLCYFIATIVGIFFKAMWDSSDFKALLKFSNMKPILIAPIVFYGVYATINTINDSLLAVLIAFQNGFFWQSILKTEQHKLEVDLASQSRLVEADIKTIETVADYRK